METPHEACSGRASLATASIVIPTDSQRAAPHCHAAVIALSTVVMRFREIFGRITHSASKKSAIDRCAGSVATGLTMRQRQRHCGESRSGAGSETRSSHSSIQNHGADCSAGSQSPLSDTAATLCPRRPKTRRPKKRTGAGPASDQGRGRAMRILASRC
jgi:hypothetical protein